jgi:predicted membrane metal-binding protein
MDLYVNLWHNLQLVESSHYLVEVDIYMLCSCLYRFVWICVRVVSVCKLFGFVLFLSVSLKKWQQTFFCCFYKINVRENRRGNQEFTIQRYRQHCAQKTQKENDQLKTKRWASRGVASLFCSASNHTLERGSFFFTRCIMVRSEVFSWVNWIHW